MSDKNTIPADVRLGKFLDEIDFILSRNEGGERIDDFQHAISESLCYLEKGRAAIAELIAERDQLARWKAEAIPLLNRAAEVANRYSERGDLGRSHLDIIERVICEALAERDRLAAEVERLNGALAESNAERDQERDLRGRYQRERNEALVRNDRIRELVRQSARNSLALAELL